MELKRIKKYKAKPPCDTINEIRNILHNLGLLFKEEHFRDKNSMFHSCRIHLCNEGLDAYDIGCNGKGMTAEYALASAYGELMERMQNNMIIFNQAYAKLKFVNNIENKQSYFYKKLLDEKLILNYYFAPDEILTQSIDEVKEVIRMFISDSNIYCNNLNDGDRLQLLPYFNVFEKKVENLPIEYISHNCLSNGMCAGNTPKEALIQGLSEIFERYVIRMIYKENLSLPSIPKEHFKGNLIYENIIQLEKETGWIIEIKDCSLGKKIPAIGVLILDKSNTKYQFHIGVDPSPITALERSLTEIFQGRTEILFHEIDFAFQCKLVEDGELKESEMFKTYVDLGGRFPISLFSNTNSYSFDGFNDSLGCSDESDLSYLIETVEKLGFKLFIRDVSYLNFPSYHIYIPGMSEIRNIFSHSLFHSQFRKTQNYFLTAHNLHQSSKNEIHLLLKYLKEQERKNNIVKFYNKQDWLLNKDNDLIYAVLYIIIGNNEEATKHINSYIERINSKDGVIFFKCLKDILYARNSGKDMDFLKNIYSFELINNVLQFMDKKNILHYFDLCYCFECENCKIISSCSFFSVLKILKKLETEYKKNIPIQAIAFQNIFN